MRASWGKMNSHWLGNIRTAWHSQNPYRCGARMAGCSTPSSLGCFHESRLTRRTDHGVYWHVELGHAGLQFGDFELSIFGSTDDAPWYRASKRFKAASRPQMAAPRVIQRKCGESCKSSPTALMSCAFCAATNLANTAFNSSSVPALAAPAKTISTNEVQFAMTSTAWRTSELRIAALKTRQAPAPENRWDRRLVCRSSLRITGLSSSVHSRRRRLKPSPG